jgi:hypothetical protein
MNPLTFLIVLAVVVWTGVGIKLWLEHRAFKRAAKNLLRVQREQEEIDRTYAVYAKMFADTKWRWWVHAKQGGMDL